MADEPRQINFTIVPAEAESGDRTYSNFCAVSHTPFDFTLTFCEVLPLSEQDVQKAQSDHVVKAPVKVRVVVPVQVLPNLIGALQEQFRAYTESYANANWPKGQVH